MQIFFWRYWIARLAICSPHVAQHGGRWRLEFSSYPVIKRLADGVAHAEPTLLVEKMHGSDFLRRYADGKRSWLEPAITPALEHRKTNWQRLPQTNSHTDQH